MADDLVVALTGASGAPYGVRLVEVLLRAGRRVHFTMSPAAAVVLAQELGRSVSLDQFDSAAFFGETDVGGPLDEGGDALVIPFVRIHKEGDLDLTSRESAA